MGTKEGKSSKKVKSTKRKKDINPKKKDLKGMNPRGKRRTDPILVQLDYISKTNELVDSFDEVTEALPNFSIIKTEKTILWCQKREYRIFSNICPYYITKACKKMGCTNYDNGFEQKKKRKREGVIFNNNNEEEADEMI